MFFWLLILAYCVKNVAPFWIAIFPWITHSCALTIPYLKDHPMTCKWLVTMVIISPISRVPLPSGLNSLQMGMILNTYKSWEDPSKEPLFHRKIIQKSFLTHPSLYQVNRFVMYILSYDHFIVWHGCIWKVTTIGGPHFGRNGHDLGSQPPF